MFSQIAVVLELEHTSEFPGEGFLLKHRLLGTPLPWASGLVGLEWSPRNWIANKFLGDADATCPGSLLWDGVFLRWKTGNPGVLQFMESKRVRHELATEQHNFQGIVKLSYSCNSRLHKVRVSSLTIWQGHSQLWYLCCFLVELFMGPDYWLCLLISEVYFQMLHFSPISLPPLPGQVYTQSFKYFREFWALGWQQNLIL